MNKIAQHLNDLLIPSKTNKRWVDKTISDILKNPIYKGERFHKGERIPYNLPILISYENWHAVHDMIKEKAISNNRSSKNINLLKGLLTCGICGKSLYMHRRKDLSDNAYKCLSTKANHSPKPCGLIGINIDLLNMFACSITLLSTNFDWDKFKSQALKQNQILHDKIYNLEHQINDWNNELSKLTTNFVKGIIKESIFIDLSKKYEDDITTVSNRILTFKSQLKPLPEQPKVFDIGMSAQNYIGEIQKFITNIEVNNIPLNLTPFNQRKDNFAYKIKFTVTPFGNISEEFTHYISSRDKRILDSSMKPTMVDLSNAKKIII
jgi:hypothetical protein